MALHFISYNSIRQRSILDSSSPRADYFRGRVRNEAKLTIFNNNSVIDRRVVGDLKIYQKFTDANFTLYLDLNTKGMIATGEFKPDGSNSHMEEKWERFSTIELSREIEMIDLYGPSSESRFNYLKNSTFLYSGGGSSIKYSYFDYSFLMTSRLFNSLKALEIKTI